MKNSTAPVFEYLKSEYFDSTFNSSYIIENIKTLSKINNLHQQLNKQREKPDLITSYNKTSDLQSFVVHMKTCISPIENENIYRVLSKVNWLSVENVNDYIFVLSNALCCKNNKTRNKYDSKDITEFKKGQEYFKNNKSFIEKKYLNSFIAIYNNEIVDNDTNFSNLAFRVYGKYGYKPIYMPYISLKPKVIKLGIPKRIK